MSPLEGSLLLMVLALVLVGLGYWLGRAWPAQQPKRFLPRPTRHSPFAPTSPGAAGVSASAPELPRAAAARPAVRQDAHSRLEQEIEQRVQALRRAREHAEPWRPPAVDGVDESSYAAWFADTAGEPYSPPKTR